MNDKPEPNIRQATARTRRLTRGLGVLSLGLGVAPLAAPAATSRLIGLDDSPSARAVLPLIGMRELISATGLLTGRARASWASSRLAGDAMDLALLGQALPDRAGDRRRRTAIATGVVAAITAIDAYAAIRATRQRGGNTMRVAASVTINRPRDEVYRFWRDLANLPRFMTHLESVRPTGDGYSHWTASGPAGRSVEWDARIERDEPHETIAWRSVGGTRVANQGSVRFTPAPGGRGTEVRVRLEFSVPAGRLGATVARLFGEHPDQQVRDDLRRFKQVMETGEVVLSEGSPEGTRAIGQLTQRPAQPVAAGH